MGHRKHLRDACQILTQGATSGVEPTGGWTPGSTIRCDYTDHEPREALNGAETAYTGATIKLPRGTTVTTAHRIRLTKKNRTVVSIDYAIIGEPEETLEQILCKVQRVTGGSAK